MVKSGQTVNSSEGVYDSRRQSSLRHLIVITPLVVAAVFCLGFAQLFSDTSKPVLTSNDAGATTSTPINELPLVTQPAIPTLNQQIEIIAPPLPDSNPESRYMRPGASQNSIGPSSKDAVKALQGVHNSQADNSNNALQGARDQIKLEDAKL